MSWSLELTQRARQDLAETRLWYEQQRAGLGGRLAAAFYAAVSKIRQAPTAQTRFGELYRKRQLQIFRYTVYFRLDRDTIYVVALVHNRRAPEFVRDKLQGG